jgi:hypothetical protein
MATLHSLEQAILNLGPQDFAAFRRWFLELDWERWDKQIERDVQDGKLDDLLNEALAEHHAGKVL